MTTALSIITDAFSKAGIIPDETPLSSAQTAKGLKILNHLIKRWSATGKMIGVSVVALSTDTVNCPDYAESALIAYTAISLCGEYGIDVTQALATDANESLEDLISASVDLSNVKPPSTFPLGSGNRSSSYDAVFSEADTPENF